MSSLWAATLAGLLGVPAVRAQLAITEVMSWASTNCPGCTESDIGPRGCHPDFWELTNFGTNAVDLGGYRFIDRDACFDASWRIPDGVTIGPISSMVFVRPWPEVSTATEFRQWWGESNLPADLQILFYERRIGFDRMEDAVRLWDAQSNLVDQVYFGKSLNGFTFTYDPLSGEVVQSQRNVCGAFEAAMCGDIGSPGTNWCDPVPLLITQQPISQTVDAGAEVTFRVRASGLPRPRGCQWYFQGAPLASASASPGDISCGLEVPLVVNYAGCGLAWKAGAKPTELILPNVQPSHAGQYFVVVSNGLDRLTSGVVTLTVNTEPTPPRVECPAAELRWPAVAGQPRTNLIVAPGQTANFEVLVGGYPPPTLHWSWSTDGTHFKDLHNATNRTLMIAYAQPSDSGIYRVRMQNSLGTNDAYASLIVKDKPRLIITEAMADSRYVSEDWWELTNVGDEPVDLYGYRWDDAKGNIGGGPTITNTVIMQPGESVIFLEGHTPEFFKAWWGASNLPPGLQFVTYAANGLAFDGDELNLWNPTAADDDDWLDQVIFADAVPGATFWFDTEACPLSRFASLPSIEGEYWTFRAVHGGDVGSPGWTRWTPPRLTSIRCEDFHIVLECKAQEGSVNVVQYAGSLAGPPAAIAWTDLGLPDNCTNGTWTAIDDISSTDSQRFYRVKMIAPANCPCPELLAP